MSSRQRLDRLAVVATRAAARETFRQIARSAKIPGGDQRIDALRRALLIGYSVLRCVLAGDHEQPARNASYEPYKQS